MEVDTCRSASAALFDHRTGPLPNRNPQSIGSQSPPARGRHRMTLNYFDFLCLSAGAVLEMSPRIREFDRSRQCFLRALPGHSGPTPGRRGARPTQLPIFGFSVSLWLSGNFDPTFVFSTGLSEIRSRIVFLSRPVSLAAGLRHMAFSVMLRFADAEKLPRSMNADAGRRLGSVIFPRSVSRHGRDFKREGRVIPPPRRCPLH